MPQPISNQDAGLQALQDALGTSLKLLRWALLLIFVAYLASGVFVVRQHERAFVLVFGKIAGTADHRVKDPGLHWTLPRPFSTIVRVPVERVQSLSSPTFWHSAQESFTQEEPRADSETLNPETDGYILTGDANILHARWAVRFTVQDPERYLFAIADTDQAVQRELDRAVVKASAGFAIDRALRTDMATLRDQVAFELDRRCADLGLGIRVQGVDLLANIPPLQVSDAFDDVVQAEQERDKQISEARAYAARTMNESTGEAGRLRVEGETYKRRTISEISADADAFQRVYEKYRRNPSVFTQTLLQDTLRRSLAGVEQKYVVHATKANAQEIRLQLGPEANMENEE